MRRMEVFRDFPFMRERMKFRILMILFNLILVIQSSVIQEQSLCPHIGQNIRSLPEAEVSHFYDDLHIASSFPSSAEEPRFITKYTQSRIRAIEGNPVTLHCEIENLGTHKRLWYKYDYRGDSKDIALRETLFEEDRAITVQELILDKLGLFYLNVTEKSYSLWFPRVSRTNAGKYICEFKTTSGSSQLNFSLDVSYPPEINDILPNKAPYRTIYQPSKVFVNETDNITMYCDVSASPLPYTTWHRVGAPELGICANESLPLIAVTPSQSGDYTCTSENSLGIVRHTIELVVQYPPRVRAEMTDLRGAAGKYLLLKCSIDAIPKARLHWEKDGEMISSLDLDYFVIISLDPKTDYGRYSCVGTNLLGSTRAEINVTGLPVKPVVVSDPNGTRKHIYLLRWRTSVERQDAITEQLPVDVYDISYRKVVTQTLAGGLQRVRYEPLESMRETYHSKGWKEYHSFILRDLSLNSTYEGILCPRNQYGRGECTNFSFTTSYEDSLAEPPPVNPGTGQIDNRVTISPPQRVLGDATSNTPSVIHIFITVFYTVTMMLLQHHTRYSL